MITLPPDTIQSTAHNGVNPVVWKIVRVEGVNDRGRVIKEIWGEGLEPETSIEFEGPFADANEYWARMAQG